MHHKLMAFYTISSSNNNMHSPHRFFKLKMLYLDIYMSLIYFNGLAITCLEKELSPLQKKPKYQQKKQYCIVLMLEGISASRSKKMDLQCILFQQVIRICLTIKIVHGHLSSEGSSQIEVGAFDVLLTVIGKENDGVVGDVKGR